MQPFLVAAFNRIRKTVGNGSCWIVVEEPGRLTLALLQRGAWVAIRSRRSDERWRVVLPEILERESAFLGLDQPCTRVIVCAQGEFDPEYARRMARAGGELPRARARVGIMQQLQIDFSGTRRGSPWLGRVLLALAACVALDAAWSYHAARSTLSENQARVAKRTPGGAAPKATPQEVAAVRDTVQRLSLPWGELFSALESAASDRVALAGIEPDAKAGTVTITGDGKDYLAALSYVA